MARGKRYEFTKPTKQAALRRSGGLCEAQGRVYGHEPGQRCFRSLAEGVEFDHYPLPAHVPGSDTLDNCVACCPACHKHKTRKYDVPRHYKEIRVQAKHNGTAKPSKTPLRGNGRKIRSGGFNRPPPRVRYIDREEEDDTS